MLLVEIYNKIRYSINADRIGPDLPFTHWRLHFRSTMKRLCQKRFKKFADSSIELNINMRVTDYSAQYLLTHVLLKELHKKFKEENINLPYPTRRIFQADAQEGSQKY